jgi:hypothetical protein
MPLKKQKRRKKRRFPEHFVLDWGKMRSGGSEHRRSASQGAA